MSLGGKSVIKKILIFVIVIPFLSLSFVFISIFFPSYIESPEEAENAKFGLPFRYIEQDLISSGAYDIIDIKGFPNYFGLQTDFLDHDIDYKFSRLNFILSFVTTYLIVLIIALLLKFIRNK